MTSFFNIIDFMALMPTYLELIINAAGGNTSVVLDLRLLRLIRLLKIAKTYSGIQIFILTMERALQPALMLLFFLSVGVVLFSALLYLIPVRGSRPASGESFEESQERIRRYLRKRDRIRIEFLAKIVWFLNQVCVLYRLLL